MTPHRRFGVPPGGQKGRKSPPGAFWSCSDCRALNGPVSPGWPRSRRRASKDRTADRGAKSLPRSTSAAQRGAQWDRPNPRREGPSAQTTGSKGTGSRLTRSGPSSRRSRGRSIIDPTWGEGDGRKTPRRRSVLERSLDHGGGTSKGQGAPERLDTISVTGARNARSIARMRAFMRRRIEKTTARITPRFAFDAKLDAAWEALTDEERERIFKKVIDYRGNEHELPRIVARELGVKL